MKQNENDKDKLNELPSSSSDDINNAKSKSSNEAVPTTKKVQSAQARISKTLVDEMSRSLTKRFIGEALALQKCGSGLPEQGNGVDDEQQPSSTTINEEDELFYSEMVDVERQLEVEAEMLLGGQNDMGYKYRQPLYSCRTCFSETGKFAGICYGCSTNCHADHDLIELYTKRKFCCDCGNSKFKSVKCQLYEEKLPENVYNKYSHNFKGLYCACKQAYPPPEESLETIHEEICDEGMYQCVMCEDWFHLAHTLPSFTEARAKGPDAFKHEMDVSFADGDRELICSCCVIKFPFVRCYKDQEADRLEEGTNNIENAENIGSCKLEKFRQDVNTDDNVGGILLKMKWRKMLCQCLKCINQYEDLDCTWLLDKEDSMDYYEEQNRLSMKAKGEKTVAEQWEMAEKMVSDPTVLYKAVVDETKDPETALNITLHFEQMKRKIAETAERCNAEGRAVSSEDVEHMFSELRASKRPRLDGSSNFPWTQ